MNERATALRRATDHWVGSFVAMSCPCEVLVDETSEEVARDVVRVAAEEAWRIERKFSRYREDNVVHQINAADGHAVEVDAETARLIDFGANLTVASDGAFDLTSGVLRKAWRFDGGDHVPDVGVVNDLLALVGWKQVEWERPRLRLAPGMQIDFGGIGKEYAVDRSVRLIAMTHPALGALVNFGGDLAIGGVRKANRAWTVGVEQVDRIGEPLETLAIRAGAMATSGDARRFVLREGRRYSHILDARTGWPVRDAPRSVTAFASSCTEAGTLSTLASLKGSEAARFLASTGVRHWVQ